MKDEIGLVPSLLDRLTDKDPRSNQDAKYYRGISISKYRESILRDILFLLNTTCLHSEQLEILLPSHVKSSTINYGIPAFSGVNISDIDWVSVQNLIFESLVNFEPRLEGSGLKVLVHIENDLHFNHNQLLIEIKGMIKLNPYPREFWLRTTIDVETGLFSLVDGSVDE